MNIWGNTAGRAANAFIALCLRLFRQPSPISSAEESLLFPQYGLSDEKSGGAATQQALRGIALIFRDTLKKSRMFPSSLGGGESAAEALGECPLRNGFACAAVLCGSMCVLPDFSSGTMLAAGVQGGVSY